MKSKSKYKSRQKLALGIAAAVLAVSGSLLPAAPLSAYAADSIFQAHGETPGITAPLSAYAADSAPSQAEDTQLLEPAVFFSGSADNLPVSESSPAGLQNSTAGNSTARLRSSFAENSTAGLQNDSAESSTARLRSSFAGSSLTGIDQKIYDRLKEEIGNAADGKRTSTQIDIPVKDLLEQLKYTEEELGVTLYDQAAQSMISKDRQAEILNQFISQRILSVENLYKLYYALLADCPYEFYWYDKSATGSFSLSTSGVQLRRDGSGACLYFDDAVLTFSFLVDAAYGSGYETDARKISAARTAAANADKIVQEAAHMTDYQKLMHYRKKICELVSYDYSAVADRSPGNKNPWQLIYVFDNDIRTNVVCEGYAKAFQYLCDRTVFQNEDIYSYLVSGTMADAVGSGLHMWNIVHMGEYGNYLADLTNSDTGTPGADGSLFLTGYAAGSAPGGYHIAASSRSVFYQYGEHMADIYPDEALTLVNGGRLKETDIHDHAWHALKVIDASCTAPGEILYSCTICGRTKTEKTDAAGHAYEASYIWSDTDSTCTVAMFCRNDPSHTAAQPQEAGLENKTITMDVRDAAGNMKYKLKLETQELSAGNSLFLYRLDNETGGCLIVDDKTYTADDDGRLCISADAGADRTYQLVTAAQADAISQAVLETVAMKQLSVVLKKGRSIKAILSGRLNMENVKSIAYTSSKKAAVKVSAQGTVKAKKAGTAVITADVTLKNGLSKAVSMKVKVVK